jgi:feruloyl esterase
MPSLGDTVAALARLRKAQAQSAEGRFPGPEALEARAFDPNPGELRMLAFAPAALPAKAPLVVTLHGCGQSGDGYARSSGWLDLARAGGFALLAPEQSPRNNPNRCFNWFEPEDVRRGFGEAASIRAMTERMILDHDLDRERVFVTGLSAGGAMTAVLLACYPDVYAAGAVIAGVPVGVADGLASAFGAMRAGTSESGPSLGARLKAAGAGTGRAPRLCVWHGDADGTVAVANAEGLARQWTSSLGLAAAPGATVTLDGVERRIWSGAVPGEPLVEVNIVRGLGHGAPLATTGPDGLGATAPFMLETGVSSTREIARFFGLREAEAPVERPLGAGAAQALGAAPARSPAALVSASLEQRIPEEIRGVIMKALKAAGLS